MRFRVLLILTGFVLPGALSSQSLRPTEPRPKTADKAAEKNDAVPKAYLPPPGMCRIWLDNVPASRQPAPTDCPTAIRNRPPNARVIFPAARKTPPKAPASPRARPDTTKRKPPA